MYKMGRGIVLPPRNVVDMNIYHYLRYRSDGCWEWTLNRGMDTGIKSCWKLASFI